MLLSYGHGTKKVEFRHTVQGKSQKEKLGRSFTLDLSFHFYKDPLEDGWYYECVHPCVHVCVKFAHVFLGKRGWQPSGVSF